jgi:nitrate reductase gamma subunit
MALISTQVSLVVHALVQDTDDSWTLVADAHPIFKAHLFLGMTIFLVFPFTRLVHVWSAPVWYLGAARLPGGAHQPACSAAASHAPRR